MSPDMRNRFDLRRGRLAHNLAAISALRARMQIGGGPDPLDLPGLAWLLQQSYSEIEEVFKAVSSHFGEDIAPTGAWHRNLLDAMSAATEKRACVISPALRQDLETYLAFRHFSRNATFPDIDAEQLAPLLDGLPNVVEKFSADLEAFLSTQDP